MAISSVRRSVFIVAILAMCSLALASMTGCGEEAVAKRSLKKVVHEEIKQFNKYHQREIKSNVYQSRGGFYRMFKERVDPETTMRRTNSVDTPYIATIRFTENTYLTLRRPTSAEAQHDSHFSLADSINSEVVYTYVGGAWRKKEIY